MSVLEQCRSCLNALAAIVSLLSGRPEVCGISSDDVNEELERLRLWIGNIGAFHTSDASLSLEYRLREAKDVLSHIHRLLEDLQEVCEELQDVLLTEQATATGAAISEHDPANTKQSLDSQQSEAVDLVEEVGACISRLFRVSKLVRKASPRDTFAIALSRDRYLFNDQFDIGHVGEKYPKLADESFDWLRNRLGRAITHRRHYLSYIRDHRGKLEGDLTQETPTANVLSGINRAEIMPTQVALKPEPDSGSRPSTFLTKASTLAPEKLAQLSLSAQNDSDSGDDARTYTTVSRSVEGGPDASLIERIPKLTELRKENRKDFECPFCFRLKSFRSESLWRRHVFSDLRAYVCTFADCDGPYFSDVNEWFRHEMTMHRVHYQCVLCKSKRFSAKHRYIAHIETAHSEIARGANQEQLLGIARIPVEQIPAQECPCCAEWPGRLRERLISEGNSADAVDEVITVTPTDFKRHLASHLEQLALFTLPIVSHGDDDLHSNRAIEMNTDSHHLSLPISQPADVDDTSSVVGDSAATAGDSAVPKRDSAATAADSDASTEDPASPMEGPVPTGGAPSTTSEDPVATMEDDGPTAEGDASPAEEPVAKASMFVSLDLQDQFTEEDWSAFEDRYSLKIESRNVHQNALQVDVVGTRIQFLKFWDFLEEFQVFLKRRRAAKAKAAWRGFRGAVERKRHQRELRVPMLLEKHFWERLESDIAAYEQLLSVSIEYRTIGSTDIEITIIGTSGDGGTAHRAWEFFSRLRKLFIRQSARRAYSVLEKWGPDIWNKDLGSEDGLHNSEHTNLPEDVPRRSGGTDEPSKLEEDSINIANTGRAIPDTTVDTTQENPEDTELDPIGRLLRMEAAAGQPEISASSTGEGPDEINRSTHNKHLSINPESVVVEQELSDTTGQAQKEVQPRACRVLEDLGSSNPPIMQAKKGDILITISEPIFLELLIVPEPKTEWYLFACFPDEYLDRQRTHQPCTVRLVPERAIATLPQQIPGISELDRHYSVWWGVEYQRATDIYEQLDTELLILENKFQVRILHLNYILGKDGQHPQQLLRIIGLRHREAINSLQRLLSYIVNLESPFFVELKSPRSLPQLRMGFFPREVSELNAPGTVPKPERRFPEGIVFVATEEYGNMFAVQRFHIESRTIETFDIPKDCLSWDAEKYDAWRRRVAELP
ncbi:hypothetical protein M011DRAFT_212531 [Sporormia fimetaria CBS 119925]|uniref:C2H2-type domain-containing protein n=1 Tax=Sporormia fimetaria CBS 119925 TaxID=1340428 RepID=A0A6A6V186_9PLEO|nr:hypothetical protein M011DRAFT_212531 [Sporormia fimetaria CBS 119925]